MLVKIYFGLWAALALAVITALLAGSFGGIFAVTVGFIAFGLTFMGMLSVLPTVMAPKPHEGHIELTKPAASLDQPVATKKQPRYAEFAGGFHGNAVPRSL